MSIGPRAFKVHPKVPAFRVSPLGVVPKKLPGEFQDTQPILPTGVVR